MLRPPQRRSGQTGCFAPGRGHPDSQEAEFLRVGSRVVAMASLALPLPNPSGHETAAEELLLFRLLLASGCHQGTESPSFRPRLAERDHVRGDQGGGVGSEVGDDLASTV